MNAVGASVGDRLVDGPGTNKGTGWAVWASWSLPESLDPVAKAQKLAKWSVAGSLMTATVR